MNGYVGIDTIRITVATEHAHTGTFGLPCGRGRLLGRGLNVDVEASLARRFYGHNADALPLRLLEHAMDDLLDEVNTWAPLAASASDLGQLPLQRVDLVRDFTDVHNADQLLDGLAAVPRSGAVVRAAFGRGEATQTLSVGTTSWRAALYDKAAQRTKVSRPGDVRYELRLRRKRLRQQWAKNNGGIVNVVADLTETKAESLARAGFHDAAFDSAVGGSMWDRLRMDERLSEHQRVSLMGYDRLRELGCQPHLSRNTIASYRRRVRTLRPSQGAIALDWESGTARAIFSC